MFKFITFFTFFQAGLILSSFSQDTISLSWCLDKTVQNHPRNGNSAIIQGISDNKIRNIRSGNLPQMELNGKASYQSDAITIDIPIPGIDFPSSPKDQYKVSLDITQSIYDGGISKSKEKIEEISKQVDISQLEIDLYTSKMQVKALYYSILLIQKSLEITEISVKQLQENRVIIEAGIKNGVLLDTDRDLLDVETIKLQQRKSELKAAKVAGIKVLAFKLGENIDQSATLAVTTFKSPEKDSIQRIEEALFGFQSEALNSSKALVKSRSLPKLYAFGQFAYGNPGLNMLKDEFNSYYIVGAGLKWTIWDWNVNSRDREVIEYQKSIIESRKLQFESEINSALINQKSVIKNHEENLIAFENILNLRTRISMTAKVQLEQGVIKTLDYIAVFNQEVIARMQLENERTLLQQSIAKYLEISGEI